MRVSPIRRIPLAHKLGTGALLLVLLSISAFALLPAASSKGQTDEQLDGNVAGLATGLEGLEIGGVANESAETNPEAAEGLELNGMTRERAGELLESVFEPQLGAMDAGLGDELDVQEYLSPTVAVVGSGDGNGANEKRALLDSTFPLQAKTASGSLEPVDLRLISQENAIKVANPSVRVTIPKEVSDPVTIPNAGIKVALATESETKASLLDGGEAAFYPDVAKDTDFAIAPSPTGVETFTQIRTESAPTTVQFDLSLPDGAALSQADEGGAIVTEGEKLLMTIPPPSAIDADGTPVPLSMEVSGSNLIVTASPGAEAAYPILVDPLFQTYEWANETGPQASGIYTGKSGEQAYLGIWETLHHEEWSPEVTGETKPKHIYLAEDWRANYHNPLGLWVETNGGEGTVTAGTHAAWVYTVPRYFSDQEKYGAYPESFISHMSLWNLTQMSYGQRPSPYMELGLMRPDGTWASNLTHTSEAEHNLTDLTHRYEFLGDQEAKIGSVGLWALENFGASEGGASVFVQSAQIELSEPSSNVPKFGTPLAGPPGWVNASAQPIEFTISDSGLGVYAIKTTPELTGTPPTWTTKYGCVGVGGSACPHTWSWSAGPKLEYDPMSLPTGIDFLKLFAEDPLGHVSSAGRVEVKVDHNSPELALTGSLTEQESLGTRRATYTLKATGADGNAEHPQSGIAKAELKLDGKAVAMEGKQAEEWSPKCTTKNCPLAAEWTLSSASVAEGKHTVEVIATDAVGNATTKTLAIETHAATAPTLTLSGSMTEQATLGTQRPRYLLKAKSTAMSAGFETPTLGATPTYTSSVVSAASGNGEFSNPADVATDASGNVWIVDTGNGRLQKFNEKGEWLLSAGSNGSGAGMLKRPSGLATDSKGNVWVADTANNRIVEFNENGAFVETFGTNVNKTKVEAAGSEAEKNLCTAASGNVCQAATASSAAGQLKEPQGIALTSGGNIWVADTRNNRIEKFGPTGTLINNLSGEGTEPGKLKEPAAITVAPDGSIWVADTGNKRIEQWNSSLTFLRAVGKQGSGAGEFIYPTGIEADANGEIWVADPKYPRVQEFDEWGAYLGTFGSAGSGSGQFATQFPAPPGGMALAVTAMGVTVDSKGSVWVTDPGNARLQHWVIPGFPVYSSSVGSLGSGNGQFTHLAGLASDGNKGHVWALDQELGRLQEFGEKGEWLRNAGSKGSGAAQLSSPAALASNGLGNVWVADTANNRIVEFNENGTFVEAFGTNVNKTKVEAGGTEAEKNLCTAASGNVCQAATAGSAAGQLKEPKGIALTSGGNVWVADTGNNRIEKFGPTGTLINNLSGEGTEPGKLKEPAAITVAPDGSIWVADTGNNRLEQWNSSLALVRTVGKEGSGGGEFKAPTAITADSSGNIWVADQKDNRIEEFSEGGKYRGQFGANGSAKFSLSSPMGIAVDNGGSIWVADPGHSKIQRWSQETPRSEITTTLWLDGKQQTGLHGTCKSAGCTIEPQWTAESQTLSTGSHTARVKTTDGLGRSTESTLTFQIARDTTKPTIEAGGELFSAPSGWVEQEAYGLNATATDAGFGVTSIEFKIDGKQVAATTQSCPDGGCKETLSKQVSMAGYAGGSHPAEIVAKDGTGNTEVKRWTINVDPEGHISTAEAEATLEALDSTSEASVVVPNSELISQGEQEEGNDPILHQGIGELVSTGTPNLSVLSTEPAEGFAIGIPNSTIEVQPTAIAVGASVSTIVQESAAVSSNTKTNVDTILRPVFDGLMAFQEIRDQSAPEFFEWEVLLREGQTLHALSEQAAEVDLSDGSPAMTIMVEAAHDAVGASVPTNLSVSEGHVITLRVEHKDPNRHFVYPIVAGTGWAGGVNTEQVAAPKDQKELREERERKEIEEQEAAKRQKEEEERYQEEVEAGTAGGPVGHGYLSPPELLPYNNTDNEGASASAAAPHYAITYTYDLCAYEGPGGCYPYDLTLKSRFEYNHHYAWWKESKPHPSCPHSTHGFSANLEFCNWVGNNHQKYGGGYHITSKGVWSLAPGGGPFEEPEPISVYMYGDGYANGHNTACICNPLPTN